MANQAPKPKKQREGFFEAILNKAEDTKAARGGRPDPWLERKFAVSLAVGIVGWTVYVVIVRICVPMLQQRSLAGSRGRGVAFLIIFVLLLLMFSWTYFRVVLSSPGVVRDYVTQAEVSADPYSRYSPEPLPPSFRHPSEFAGSPAQVESAGIDSPPPAPPSSDRAESSIAHAASSSPSPAPLLSPPSQAPDQPVAAPVPSSGPVQSPSKQSCCPPPLIATRAGEKRALAVEEARGRDDPNTWERQPPQPEILGRWCGYCEVARPPRAHHCRICGTCVLNMDHHCPWVGVCIGQQNHKYFLNFTYWSTVFTIFCLLISAITFGTLYINGERDKETLGMIGSIIGISTFFSMLTIAMAGSHTYLILINMSTIESYALRPFHARESALLSKQHGPLPTPARRRTLRSLEREWGRVTHEGNRWWLGTRRNWQGTMGTNPLGWVFPIAGKGVNKGLVWETNPRVGPDGSWRRRSEWPEELR